MTQDDVIRMAREVGDMLADSRGRMTFCFDEYGLEAFAKLVASHEREACAKVCAELGEWACVQDIGLRYFQSTEQR